MSNLNIRKSNTVLIIVIVATSLTEVITLRQAEVLVNESAFISCSSKEVRRIQWHHTPPGKQSNKYVYAGGRFYSPYNKGRFRVDNDLTTNVYTLTITNVMHEDAGLYECKDDVLSGVFGSAHLTVLDSSPVCTSNMNSNGFAGPNTCNIEQENMIFSCSVSFSGNSPNLMWSTLNGNQSLNSSICERKDNRINCSLSMKADPSFDGSTFICQTTSNDARHNCSIEDIRVEYFFGDYEAAEKKVGNNVTCMVRSNLKIHYTWTMQQNNQDNIISANRRILFQEPGLYKCSVKYNIRNVTCYASIVAAIVSNIVDNKSINVSVKQSNGLAIGLSIGLSMCLFAVIAFFIYKKYIKGSRVSSDVSVESESLLPLNASTTPEKNIKEFTEEKQIEMNARMNRLMIADDFPYKECIEDVEFLSNASYEFTYSQGEKLGDLLATLGVTELFIKIWKKYFGEDFLKDAKSLMFKLMHNILWVLCNSMNESTALCIQVFESGLHKVVLDYTDHLDPSKTVDSHCKSVVGGLMGVLYNMLQKVPESSQSLREMNAFGVLQRFRISRNFEIACRALILQGYIITEEENELVNSDDSNFIFLKHFLDEALKPNNSGRRAYGFSPFEVMSALNRLAVNDNNKINIVKVGLLPFYVKLLKPQCSEVEKEAAAEGLRIMAFKCTHEIKNEPGCVAALKKLAKANSERLKRAAEGVLLILKESKREKHSGGANQRVELPEVPGLRREFFIVSEMNGKVLDISYGDSSPGALVIVYPKKSPPSKNQLWYIDSSGFIHSALNDLVPESSGGALVEMAYLSGDCSQQWTVEGNKIVSKTGECLNIKGSGSLGGTPVISYTYFNASNKHWRLEYV